MLMLKHPSLQLQLTLPVQEPKSGKMPILMSSSKQTEKLTRHKYLYNNNEGPHVKMTQIDDSRNNP